MPKEELASRLWARVWDMRAAYIRLGMLGDEHSHSEQRTIAHDALWHTARVIDIVAQYIDRYGHQVISGEVRYQTEAVISLAAWPTFPADFGSEERDRLRLALHRAGHDPHPFVNELTRDELGQRILHTWDTHILDATR
jgi:hypothetical protein